MKKYYRVARHLFCLEMADKHAAWPLLYNYEPFCTEQAEDPVFSLQVVEGLSYPSLRHVLTDGKEEDMPRIEVYRTGDGDDAPWLFQVAQWRDTAICCRLLTDAAFSHAQLQLLDGSEGRFAIDNALMLLFAFATAQKNTLEMHASVTVKDEMAYLFLGQSGTGKSTHSRLWQEVFTDAWLLNDDNPVVRLEEDGLYCYGTPWSGKTPCYKNKRQKVGAFVQLQQAPQNEIERMTLPAAYASIYSSSSGLKVSRPMADGLYNTLSALLMQVSCYYLRCLPNREAAELCYATISAK